MRRLFPPFNYAATGNSICFSDALYIMLFYLRYSLEREFSWRIALRRFLFLVSIYLYRFGSHFRVRSVGNASLDFDPLRDHHHKASPLKSFEKVLFRRFDEGEAKICSRRDSNSRPSDHNRPDVEIRQGYETDALPTTPQKRYQSLLKLRIFLIYL